MSNPLHDLANAFHNFGNEVKIIAEKIETAFKTQEAPVVAEAEKAAESVVASVAEDAIKAAERAAAQAHPGA